MHGGGSVSVPQRIIILAGLAGILHSSLVPPVVQTAAGVCRYTQFMLRAWPFTKGYAVAHLDLAALVSEYGIILSSGAMAWIIAGWWEGRQRQDARGTAREREGPVA